MQFIIDNKFYPVVIQKKKTTKNLYIRVKEDLTIYVTCNYFTPDKKIKSILEENKSSIMRMINRMQKKQEYNNQFYFLGKHYDIIYTDSDELVLGENKAFVPHNFDLDKWKKKQALGLFQKHLDMCYQNYSRNIPYPSLRLRKMKSRWGVCNVKTHVITLNTELINKDTKCLDYVIIHELSHLLEANHSKRFWNLVEENCPNYKIYRKLTNELGDE